MIVPTRKSGVTVATEVIFAKVGVAVLGVMLAGPCVGIDDMGTRAGAWAPRPQLVKTKENIKSRDLKNHILGMAIML